MKNNYFKKNESAVSPVIGVMLMLIVTIIIAAMVTAFAGGVIDTGGKSSSVLITGTYSQDSGLVVTHAGGDSIDTSNVRIIISLDEDFGNVEYIWSIPQDYLFSNRSVAYTYGNWTNAADAGLNVAVSGSWGQNKAGVSAFTAGDSFYVKADCLQLPVDGNPDLSTARYTDFYDISKSRNVGKHFYVMVLRDDKTIAKARVLVST